MSTIISYKNKLEKNKMTFGKILKQIRRDKGKTQREVAKAIDMDFGYFSKLENDKFDSQPILETIDKIALELDCTEVERASLREAAGRITKEMELVAKKASADPVLAKLYRSAIHLSPERLIEIADEIELEIQGDKSQMEK
jgi:HTH-type transcriptional regulator, competence development regulator